MSPSEEAAKLSSLGGRVARADRADQRRPENWPLWRPRDVTNLVTEGSSFTRRYAEELESEVPAVDSTVSTTEAMVVACALLRAQHMNPFDLALWFSEDDAESI